MSFLVKDGIKSSSDQCLVILCCTTQCSSTSLVKIMYPWGFKFSEFCYENSGDGTCWATYWLFQFISEYWQEKIGIFVWRFVKELMFAPLLPYLLCVELLVEKPVLPTSCEVLPLVFLCSQPTSLRQTILERLEVNLAKSLSKIFCLRLVSWETRNYDENPVRIALKLSELLLTSTTLLSVLWVKMITLRS